MLEHHERKLLEQILEVVLSNQTALTDLQASVAALQAAAGNAPADISSGVETAASDINAVTTQLGGTPPAASGSSSSTPTAPAAPAATPAEAAPAEENPVPDPNPPA